MTTRKFSWAFLVLEAHPYGRAMLRELLAGGFVPDLIIEERSAIAVAEHDKFVARVAGWPLAPSFDVLLEGRPTRREFVPHHNRDQCEQLLAALRPELIVLGGTRILKPRIFAHAERGTLNSHPGLLPEVRGSASVAWAIHLDQPMGCTCHLIQAGIDTGPIVGRRELEVHRGDTYEKLCHATLELSATLMREALESFRDGSMQVTPQGEGPPAHRNMSGEMLVRVKRKLASGDYGHFVD